MIFSAFGKTGNNFFVQYQIKCDLFGFDTGIRDFTDKFVYTVIPQPENSGRVRDHSQKLGRAEEPMNAMVVQGLLSDVCNT